MAERIRGAHLSEPPAGTVRRALALGAGLAPERPGGLLASLLFDSGLAPAAAGIRGAAVEARRVLFGLRAPDDPGVGLELDVEIRETPAGALELMAHLAPPRAGWTLEARAGRVVRRARANEAGEFRVRGLPQDEIRLRLIPEGAGPLDLPPLSWSRDEP